MAKYWSGNTSASKSSGNGWLEAFQATHGGLTPDEYNYLQALYRASQAQTPAAASPAPESSAPQPPSIEPFLTPEQQISFTQANFQNSTSLAEIDRALEDLRAKTNYQRTQNDKEFKDTTSQAKDAYAARGLSQSSVKDAGLYDLQAQNAMRQQFLQDQLTNAELSAENQKQNIRNYASDLARSRASMMAQNAAQAASQLAPPPAPGPSPSPAPAAPAAPENGWLTAFRKTHGGLSPEEYNYLQALYRSSRPSVP